LLGEEWNGKGKRGGKGRQRSEPNQRGAHVVMRITPSTPAGRSSLPARRIHRPAGSPPVIFPAATRRGISIAVTELRSPG
jgi:hypothetical protein